MTDFQGNYYFYRAERTYPNPDKMRSLAIALLLFAGVFSLKAQEENTRVFSQDAGQEILLGYGNRAGMEQEPFRSWFLREYNSYRPDTTLPGKLHCPFLQEMRVTVVMGTWCPDSRREVPRFYKVADMLNIPDDQITVIYVDLHKKAPGIDTDSLLIQRVPTFIFRLDGLEEGRIVEVPQGSFEKEIKKICRKITEERN